MDKIAVLLLLVLYFAFASSRVVNAFRKFYDTGLHGGLLVATLIVPYLLATLPTAGSNPAAFLDGSLRMLAYLLVPGIALLFHTKAGKWAWMLDLIAVLGIWFPIEFGWLPEVSVVLAEGVDLPLPKLTGVCLGFLLYLVIRPLDNMGYDFRLNWQDIGRALLGWGAFAVVGIPLGLALGFLRYEFAGVDLAALPMLVGGYLLVALPEEMLFRGMIQNLIERQFGRTWVTLLVAAVIFGLAHIDNTTNYHQYPNWRYVVMATLAGLAYGWVWLKQGKITASAITHALVNFMWAVLLDG